MTGGAGADPAVGALLPVARWLGYAGLALGLGVPVLLAVCWPGGWASARARRLTSWGLLALAVGTAAAFLLRGPYALGAGLGSVADPALLRATAGSEYGVVLAARLWFTVALAAALLPAWRRGGPSGPVLIAGAVLGVGLVVSTAAVGHPMAGAWPAFAVAVWSVHLAAMAVWLGGLAGVLVALLRPVVPEGEMRVALPRFSRTAFWAVVALVISGLVQAARELDTPAALGGTTYGRLLLGKLAVVLVILGAAGVARVWVQQLSSRRPRPADRRRVAAQAFPASAQQPDDALRHRSAPQVEGLPTFRRTVVLELLLAVLVLGISAVLVGSSPEGAAAAGPVGATLPLHVASGGGRAPVDVGVP